MPLHCDSVWYFGLHLKVTGDSWHTNEIKDVVPSGSLRLIFCSLSSAHEIRAGRREFTFSV